MKLLPVLSFYITVGFLVASGQGSGSIAGSRGNEVEEGRMFLAGVQDEMARHNAELGGKAPPKLRSIVGKVHDGGDREGPTVTDMDQRIELNFPPKCVADALSRIETTTTTKKQTHVCGKKFERECYVRPYRLLDLWGLSAKDKRGDVSWMDYAREAAECTCFCNMQKCRSGYVKKMVGAGMNKSCASSYFNECPAYAAAHARRCELYRQALVTTLARLGAKGGPSFGLDFQCSDPCSA